EISAALDRILDLTGDARAAALRGLDPEVRKEVEALLALDGEADRVFGASATAFAAPFLQGLAGDLDRAEEEDEIGRRIGPYQVVGMLGRGGMGTVYRARRVDGTFDQTVALKVLRRGLDTDDLLARFRAERQILAALHHPAIAQLYDGGRTEDGRPYYAMELVEGEPITDYADRHDLGTRERLRLFATVCDAVHHAHQRLVVHRDLKPSNVLVASGGAGHEAEGMGHGKAPAVKLLDFGIAKLLDPEAEAPLTRTGLRLLTPEYAAPEQLAGRAVTTATDVYGLGALLYELVAGERPFAEAGRRAVEEAVLLREPDRPSTRAAETAPTRGVPADRLRRELAGDVDVICLKALRKEPERRYASAEALRDDLLRHLDGRPVTAQPDTMGYRVRTFVRRNRAAVGAVAAIALLLVGLAGTATWAAVTTSRQSVTIAAERDRAEGLADYLVGLLGEADPYETSSDTLSVPGLIAHGIATIDEAFPNDPVAQARTLAAFGAIETRLGHFPRADSLLTLAEATLAREAPDHHEAAVAVARGRGAYHRGLGALEDAEAAYREALARFRRSGSADLGTEAELVSQLATTLLSQDRLPEADSLFTVALGTVRRLERRKEEAVALASLAETAVRRGDADRAIEYVEEALPLYRDLYGPAHLARARGLFTLGSALASAERYDRAEPLLREALDVEVRVLGPLHPDVGPSRNNLAYTLQHRDPPDYDGALRQLAAAREVYEAVPEGAYMDLAILENNIGSVHEDAGRMDEALAAYRRSVGIALDRGFVLDEGIARRNVGGALWITDDVPGAERESRRALDLVRAEVGDDHPITIIMESGVAAVSVDRRPAEAEPALRRVISRTDSVFGEGHWRGAVARFHLARLLLETRPEEGRELLREVAPALRERYVVTNGFRQRVEAILREAGV
ncbi:MAG: serine/threonine-protein kinase, partial [Bacteroidota bacterium]